MTTRLASALLITGLTWLAGSVTLAQDAASAARAGQTEQGKIAWYGKKFAGRKTASGERFDPQAMTMAHPSLPFGTRVRVTNLATDKSVTVRVNDRGPTTRDRIADVSAAAARELDMIKQGVIEARLEVIE